MERFTSFKNLKEFTNSSPTGKLSLAANEIKILNFIKILRESAISTNRTKDNEIITKSMINSNGR